MSAICEADAEAGVHYHVTRGVGRLRDTHTCLLRQKPDASTKKKKDKKKKKKKKKFSYAKWMKQATTLKRSMSQEKRDMADRIREGTGGGEFEKLDRI